MSKRILRRLDRLSAGWKRGLMLTAVTAALVLAAISCQTPSRSVVALPNVPGAKYIGSKECEQCHEQLYRDFATADHARLIAPGPNALSAGCESCHGPCSLHSDSGGETKPPFSFTAGRAKTSSYGAALPVAPARSVETLCYQCHNNVRGQFSLPSHHPVPEGKLSCTGCHPPHKGSSFVGGGTSLLSENESCLRCHSAQRGPYVFEHEATREGCTTCHTPHGSVNTKLLTVRDSNLCLKCHFQQVRGGALLIGGSDHTIRVRQGTCWTAGCHEAVHGSRVSSSLRF
ncbi:MAG TPA: cytochrome c3 family protein [Candidatus Sulfotelmatobacter sp.]|nr:cytochrome c3 family protein [Candidatus Sulfotelmatobacter sp.]HWI59091.1 cytochrome c3 family protein [Bacillota bacterium]